jgi:hypothetical protein
LETREEEVAFGAETSLGEFREPLIIQNATTNIGDQALEGFELAEFSDQPVDSIIYLDNRMLPLYVAYEVWAVPPFRMDILPFHTHSPAHVHFVTHTNPWIAVLIYEQGPRR